ncbi:MAG: Sec-independent protein translocase protein TatB [Hyphomicrobiales bacterium]
MFDLGGGELLVIGIIALIVIGPKELPGLLRTIGQSIAKLRRIAGDFQSQFNDAMKEADLGETRQILTDLHSSVRSKFDISQIAEISDQASATKPTSSAGVDTNFDRREPDTETMEAQQIRGTSSDASATPLLIVSESQGAVAIGDTKATRKRHASKQADAEQDEVEKDSR